jgi:hypothetical protein
MQERHKNRAIYFKELSITSKNYFMPYIQHWHSVDTETDVLEIGCGDGGNFPSALCSPTSYDCISGSTKSLWRKRGLHQ